VPRPDGRSADQLRPVVLERRVNPYAEGSCLIRMGGTLVHCTATVETGAPGWKKGSGEGLGHSGVRHAAQSDDRTHRA
jgi:ribonuclease PH